MVIDGVHHIADGVHFPDLLAVDIGPGDIADNAQVGGGGTAI